MPAHQWNAHAFVFQYPPLAAGGDGDPVALFAGPLRDCFRTVASLGELDRTNVEIETMDGETLYNGCDIERVLAAEEHR